MFGRRWWLTVVAILLLASCGEAGDPADDAAGATTGSVAPTTPSTLGWITPRTGDGAVPEGITVQCGVLGLPRFPSSALHRELRPLEGAEFLGADASIQEFIDRIGDEPLLADIQRTGWMVFHREGDEVLTVSLGPEGSGNLTIVSLERRGPTWAFETFYGPQPCDLWTALPEGLVPVRWRLDPEAEEPNVDSRTLHLLVDEVQCSSGQPPGSRLRGPDVLLTDDQALISFAATPPTGGTCEASPEQAAVVTLPDRLADRRLREGRDLGLRLVDLLDS